ncbi:hypothetical protein BGX27_010006 [Mortierella sp. AM989]|nr:hypothetical protein BGX27_010006 [Mortierella sp. AM989]
MLHNMLPNLCTRCFWRQQRSSSNSFPSSKSKSRTRKRLLVTTLFLINTLAPIAIQAQPPQVYTPRHSVGSAIANKTLYIVAGTVSIIPPYKATADTLALPLTAAFTTSSIPWQKLQAVNEVPDARVTKTADEGYLIMTGVGDQHGQLVVVYNIAMNSWSYLPPTAIINASPQTPRRLLGLSTDPESKKVLMYGGLLQATSTYSASTELDILNTEQSVGQWGWSSAINGAQPLPGLVQPIMLYIPTIKLTLIIGGCSQISPSNGTVLQCEPFSGGYLINTAQSMANGASVPINRVKMISVSPLPRLSPCTVVLESGDVFMYGGAIFNGSMNDAWLLNTKTWSWSQLSMSGLPGGRAGAACVLATPDQIIMVGGYDGGISGPRQFSQPQIAIINTTTWTWSGNFTPSVAPTEDIAVGTTDFSIGAVIGITIAACIVTGIFGFFLGRMLWRRWNNQRNHNNIIFGALRTSRSNERLVDGDNVTDNSGFSTIPATPFGSISTASINTSNNSDSETRTILRSRDREPFLIVPYTADLSSITSNTLSSTLSDSSTRFDTMEMATMPMGSKVKTRGKDTSNSGISKPAYIKGSQLPQDLADIQHGHYIKTLQHQKQYERRRQQDSMSATVHRMGTQDSLFGYGDGEGEDDSIELATGVINLRDIDVGEEPITGPWNPIEDGTILLSSHLDTSQFDTNN